MGIPGTVQITGVLAPTNSADTYPVTDPKYGLGGLRTVADDAAMNAVPTQRRQEGMLVYVVSSSTYYTLNPPPWGGTLADWTVFGGAGSVVSVAMTLPSFLSVAGSPITSSGTFAVTLATETANRVFAGPSASPSATPTFRALVPADIPALAESQVTNLVSDLAATEKTANKGVANGCASLNSGGLVPTSELPAALVGSVNYQGTWNATANTPTLASGVGTKGIYYLVSVAGSTTLDGISSWNVGDWAIYDGTVWQHLTGFELVTSVFARVGAITAQTGDYTVSQVTGAAPLASPALTGTVTLAGSTSGTTGLVASATASGTLTLPATTGTLATQAYVTGQGYITANQTITLSGNVTGSGTTAITTTIGAGQVTNAMLAGSITAANLVGTDIAVVGTIATGTWAGTTIAIAHGGTGQTTASTAINALVPTQTSNTGKFLTTDGTGVSWGTGNSGTVTSIALTVPGFLSVSGSPITTSGTLAITLATETAKTVFAGPISSPSATPTFRVLVASDIPDLSATYATVASLGSAAFQSTSAFDAAGAAAAITKSSLGLGSVENTALST